MSAEAVTPIQLRHPGTKDVMARSLTYLRPYWQYTVFGYLLLLINNGITLVMPQIIRRMVDQGIRGGQIEVIQWGALGLLGLVVARGVFTFFSGRWTEIASQNVAYDLRNEIHGKLQSLSFSYHDRTETGQLLARAVGDVDRVRFLTGRALIRLIDTVVLIVGVSVAMLTMNVRLALAILVLVPFLAYGALNFGRRYRPLFRTIREAMDTLTNRLEQNLRGARIVSAFAQEKSEIGRFDRDNEQVLAYNMLGARLRATNLPLLQLIASVGTILVLFYGGQLVINGRLTLGELVAFTTYVAQLVGPVRSLGWVIASISQAVASGERVFEILDAQSEVEDAPDAVPLRTTQGQVRFEHVSFSYFGRHQVLNDIDFEAQPGQVVALLGATGSGKSSVINLIPRFYDPTEGRIRIDGQDLRGRARRDPFRGAEAARRHRARDLERPPDPDPRRRHVERRHRDRGPDPGSTVPADAGPHLVRDRAALEHDPAGRPGTGARERTDRGARPAHSGPHRARAAAAVERIVRPDLSPAASPAGGSGDVRIRARTGSG
jgi:ABC-type multidrug transport system fused ATPase/permease subunit